MNFLGQSGQTGLSLFCGMTGTNLGTAWVRPEPDGVGGGGKTSTILGPSSSSESTLHQKNIIYHIKKTEYTFANGLN